jgi:glycosyl transferase family 25
MRLLSQGKTKDLSALDVDAVLCISVCEREDRRALLDEAFANSGLQVEYVLVARDNENPERGCYNSHLRCAELAFQRGYRRVLILEDDATLEFFAPRVLTRINRFLAKRNPDIFYLGVILGRLWLTWTPSIARVRAQGGHAYMLSAEACRKVIGLGDYSGRGIDNYYSKMFAGFCCFPMISQQQTEGVCASDLRQFRGGGKGFDDAFWEANWWRQFREALRGLPKTLLRRGF